MESLPLFPLHTVLFPQGKLPLRIFEARYLDLVSACLRAAAPFGVCLISTGTEAGAPAECVEVGTSALIEDWSRTPGGLLAITARGQRRFRLRSRSVGPDRLVSGVVDWLAEEPYREIPPGFRHLQAMYRDLATRLGLPLDENRLEDAGWLSCRLAELLPVEPRVKQDLLVEDKAVARLERIQELLQDAGAPRRARGHG